MKTKYFSVGYWIGLLFCSIALAPFSLQAQTKKITLPKGITEEMVKKYRFEPAGFSDGEDDYENDVVSGIPIKKQQLMPGKKYAVNLDKFCSSIHNALKDSVVGYVMQISKNGTPVCNRKWNWAQTPANSKQAWDFNTRMHVASVSKWLTAIGMMKALKLKGLSYDTKIIDYLPAYWKKGKNIDNITFGNLLNQTSGFHPNTSSSSFLLMKNTLAQDNESIGKYDYENMNFGLCRILIATVMGYVDKSTAWPDAVWDMFTIKFYKKFMQEKVFMPSGVMLADFAPFPAFKNALAYKFPDDNDDGWNSGDLATICGGTSWRLSVSDLIKVMHHARRMNDILSADEVQEGLDNKFGIDQVIPTNAGNLYNKNGGWGSKKTDGRYEQAVIYFLPENMELAILVNSRIGKAASPTSLRGIVANAYKDALEEK